MACRDDDDRTHRMACCTTAAKEAYWRGAPGTARSAWKRVRVTCSGYVASVAAETEASTEVDVALPCSLSAWYSGSCSTLNETSIMDGATPRNSAAGPS